MIVLSTLAAALLLLVLTSSALFVFDAEVVVVYPGVIIAVQAALRRRFSDAALVMLVTAWAADLLASGPPGLHGLVLTLVFFVLFSLAQRVGGRLYLATFALAAAGTVLLAFAEALLVGLVLADPAALGIWSIAVLPSAILTGIIALPYALLLSFLEQIWRQRTERSVRVE